MALKDLVAKKSEVAETVIEGIVSKHVRYYTDSMEIGFTPSGAALSGENRILVYLVALLGWQYVTDKPPTVSTKPANLELALGIPGGTLRPLLKSLKDSHLISSDAAGYSICEGNLDAIASVISGEKRLVRRVAATASKPKPKVSNKTARRSASNPIAFNIDVWIKDGFFKDARTLHAVHHRLHEHGVIARQTSVSGPLLKAVKQSRLKRQKVMEGSKEVWAYSSAGK